VFGTVNQKFTSSIAFFGGKQNTGNNAGGNSGQKAQKYFGVIIHSVFV
jgi:hypothetical protein